ncbi:MAG: glutamate--tRNA ligase [Armatimonadetes bacterium]|nr:glutamate--tRNA ligase [Armatimonadota bacterium]
MSVRVRIAPSPTGAPHVGTAYIGLFNLAFARQNGGAFILRIEDTDRERSSPVYEKQIFESLSWLGLHWDEGPDKGGPHAPYRQTERTEIYRKHVEELLAKGGAYRCFCTKERLDALREEQKKRGDDRLGYDRHCRGLSPEEVWRQLDAGTPHVIRQAIPLEGETRFTDLIRGEIAISNAIPDDQVLLKSDGFPTYHLASVVDDHLMEITHVIRAEEWINSTPKHILLYEAFGWPAPRFAHMPLLRNADRSKISKRKNPVSLKWYEAEGYLPEVMLNFLGLMGYSMPDGREMFGFQELSDGFSFDRINPAGPVFDLEKLAWLNGTYLRALPVEGVRGRLSAFTQHRLEKVDAVLPVLIERMRTLKDFDEIAGYFFNEPSYGDGTALVPKKRDAAATAKALKHFATALAATEWDKEHLEALVRAESEALGWAAKESFMAIRVAITGKTTTPPLMESMVVLGRDTCVARLNRAADALSVTA